MSTQPFAFNPTDGWNNTTSFPQKAANSAAARAMLQLPHTQTQAFLNSIIVGGWIPLPSATSLSYTSADAPNFVATASADISDAIYPGVKVMLNQDSVTKKFIVHAVSGATITLYGGTDYVLTSSTISSVYFSTAKAPAGFPLDPQKWEIEVTDNVNRTQASPIQNVWYNLGGAACQIIIPIGVWKVSYKVAAASNYSASQPDINTTLSNVANNESHPKLSCRYSPPGTAAFITATAEDYINLAAKTTFYLNASQKNTAACDNINFYNAITRMYIRAVDAYL